MLRLGIDEAERRLRNGSAADRVVREVEVFYPTLTARLRECLASPLHSSKTKTSPSSGWCSAIPQFPRNDIDIPKDFK